MQRKKQLYFKLFRMYTAIVCAAVLVLAVYFAFAFRRNLLEARAEDAGAVCQRVTEYLQEEKETSDYLYNNLYRTPQEMNDLLAYLELSSQDYWSRRLDHYAASGSLSYASIETFLNDAFEMNKRLMRIELISYSTMDMTVCEKRAMIPGKDGKQRLEALTAGKLALNEIVFQREVRDPDTLQAKGSIVFVFDGKGAIPLKSEKWMNLFVTRGYVHPVLNEKGFERWKTYLEGSQNGANMSTGHYRMFQNYVEEYQIYVFLNQIEASVLPVETLLMIVSIGILVLVASVLCVHVYIKRLTGRVGVILSGMDRVKTGDFSVQLETAQNGDELDMIAEDFNDMCDKLREHIRCRYVAEIERKNAKLEAWQSQINPHFLYNTLEAIRMKAICNGQREIGKMLYSMSVLFRSQLKEADWITVEQELAYCKQYLELFEYRYPDVFTYEIICPSALMECEVMKFILQPVLENYFVHGIRSQDKDNHLKIVVEQEAEKLRFRVIDNGRGMDAEEIERHNTELRRPLDHKFEKKSIGVNNVNRRIQAVYGEVYGIQMKPSLEGGLEVCITVGEREET